MRGPAGSGVRPSDLLILFFYYPPGWTITIFLMIVLPRSDRRALIGTIALFASVGAIAVEAADGGVAHVVRAVVVLAGVAPYAFTLARIAQTSGSGRDRWIDLLAIASFVHVASLCIPYFRDNTAIWLPRVLDADIARLDEACGAQPSALMAFAFRRLPPLGTASLIVYTFVQIPITVVAAFQWKHKEPEALSVLPAFMVGSIIGFICYWLAPAIGPKVYFAGDFPLLHAKPDYLAQLSPYDYNPHHPRNDMPSMHFSWSVMAFLFTRGFSAPARVYAAAFVFFTMCATIGLGEHYLMNLIVGMSPVLFVRGLTAARVGWRRIERLRAAAIGLAMLAAWIAGIRSHVVIEPWLTILFSAVTLAVAIWFERSLAIAEGSIAVTKPHWPTGSALPAPLFSGATRGSEPFPSSSADRTMTVLSPTRSRGAEIKRLVYAIRLRL